MFRCSVSVLWVRNEFVISIMGFDDIFTFGAKVIRRKYDSAFLRFAGLVALSVDTCSAIRLFPSLFSPVSKSSSSSPDKLRNSGISPMKVRFFFLMQPSMALSMFELYTLKMSHFV